MYLLYCMCFYWWKLAVVCYVYSTKLGRVEARCNSNNSKQAGVYSEAVAGIVKFIAAT